MASTTSLRAPVTARVQGASSTHASVNTKALINSFVGKSDALAGALDVASPFDCSLSPTFLAMGAAQAVSHIRRTLVSSSSWRTTLRHHLPQNPNLNWLARRPTTPGLPLATVGKSIREHRSDFACRSSFTLTAPEPRFASIRDTWRG